MLTAGSCLGPYEVLSALGAGGMGEVYKARDTRLDRTVAIKVLSTELAAIPIAAPGSNAKPARSPRCPSAHLRDSRRRPRRTARTIS